MFAWQAHKGKIESLTFSADGSVLATATGGTQSAYLWDPAAGTLVRKLSADWADGRTLGTVKSVAFAPDAPLFAAGTSRSVTVWRTDTWEPVADLWSENAYELAFSRGSAPTLAASTAYSIAFWGDAGRVSIGELRRADRQLPELGHHTGGVSALTFSPDNRRLAAVNCVSAEVLDVATGKLIRSLDRQRGNHRGAVRFSSDGAWLAVARGKWVDVWDEGRLATTVQAGTGRQPAVWALGWGGDGRTLMTAGADGFVRFWGVGDWRELRSFEWGIGKVYCAAFAPDGLTCAAGGSNGQVVIWDVDG